MIHAPVKEETQTTQRQPACERRQPLDYRRRLAVFLEPSLRRMSYEEFLEWADEDTLAEWVDGEVIMSSPASLPHQNIVGFLYELLRSYTFFRQLGTVIQAPFQMKMEHGQEPDLLFIRQEHYERLKNTYLDGPADLVVEVISPESAGRDRGDKFYEYERGGVPEYWLIDPLSLRVEFYQLKAGQYHIGPIASGNIYHSQVLSSFWIHIDWLWKTPLPHPLEALGEIAGIDSQEISRFMRLLQGKQ
ncbi:MAG: Uma2 family endonuclease [bacterium]|nr:Uma2 family endonuclease [bacterium]